MNNVQTEKKSGILFAQINIQDFTMYNVPDVKKVIDLNIDESIHSLLIDMRNVRIVDSSAFDALFRIRAKLVIKDGIVGLVNLHPEVAKMVHLLNLENLFPVFSSNEAGIKAANAGRIANARMHS